MQPDPPFTCSILLNLLDEENIAYQCVSHPPLMTVADAKAIRVLDKSGQGQVKNLFLKNKKGRMWLLTLHEDRKIDLNETARRIGTRRFSFCSRERLMQYLGVEPGAVSPFGLLNDVQHEVEFYIDEILLDHSVIHVHPLDNTKTVTMGTRDLLEFLKRHGHPFNVLER